MDRSVEYEQLLHELHQMYLSQRATVSDLTGIRSNRFHLIRYFIADHEPGSRVGHQRSNEFS